MATDSSPDVSDAPSSPVGFACYGSWPNGSPIDCYFDTAWAGGDGGVCATYQPYGRYQEKPHCPAQGLVGCCVGRAADRTTAYCVYTTPAPDCGFCPPGVTCTWEHMSP